MLRVTSIVAVLLLVLWCCSETTQGARDARCTVIGGVNWMLVQNEGSNILELVPGGPEGISEVIVPWILDGIFPVSPFGATFSFWLSCAYQQQERERKKRKRKGDFTLAKSKAS